VSSQACTVLVKGLSKYLGNAGALDRQSKKLRQMGLKSHYVRAAALACSSAQQVKQETEAKAKEAEELAKKNAAAKTMVADLFGNDDELWLPATAPTAPGGSAAEAPKANSQASTTKKVATSSMFGDDDDDSDDGLFG
jgi:hypothetical protein